MLWLNRGIDKRAKHNREENILVSKLTITHMWENHSWNDCRKEKKSLNRNTFEKSDLMSDIIKKINSVKIFRGL